ncbi:type II toxin-antitoxin system RnlB family antitoxin [Bacillus safensis]|uniref:type II toxin-antitoxin system RnlB family antitoxin n=1 Tax=Bacillus TaxID=1386 RepID=UPI00163D261C|nr:MULTISPECIES: type II toxin-antitoxin system RnlB family antitoxin [Bacillus]MBU8967513.1 type II toxin-antitoxin system RnlB family antitoxin [Bacillus altitudinis]MCY7431770.1 type II toxin-antitoxin system RnlB family antitoxin [Bacillus safensis]MCY7673014.1 type II toxin-antitoxin system RnlB family antitoxin [Bacillus altitudinis]MDR7667642.1 type II toxin-antitoxin system RnlB family antitoxin [Bacillus altitudinis]
MKNYEIQELHNCQMYPFVVFSTSYVNPLEDIEYIQEELKDRFEGKVLFDLLLSNGNSSNRYLEAEFNGFHFDFSSFKVLEKVDTFLKETTGRFYQNHPNYLPNSILPNAHQFLIKKGKFL